ncbi:ATP-binding protein, partial [Mesorhizobium sp. M6A.T.Cr.TU.017.01.1.1]
GDIWGVQPMTGPSGLIFAMKARFANTTNLLDTTQEALFNEADTDFSGTGTHANALGATSETTGTGVTTANMEANTAYEEMGFTIDKVTVTAKSRALKAEYTTELAQDLKAIHGLDAETELANILSAEIMLEIQPR